MNPEVVGLIVFFGAVVLVLGASAWLWKKVFNQQEQQRTQAKQHSATKLLRKFRQQKAGRYRIR